MERDLLPHQVALLKLAERGGRDLPSFIREAVRAEAELLKVERVSFWVLEKDPDRLRCEALYLRSKNAFEEGMVFLERERPAYVTALKRERMVIADDARRDPRTREFEHDYLVPHDIRSMMDVPIWVKGQLGGVLCHEHVGSPRLFLSQEADLAQSVAHLFSLQLETFEREKVERALEESEERFSLLSEQASDYDLMILDDQGRIQIGAERIRGYKISELRGQGVSLFYPPEDVEAGRPKRALEEAARHGVFEEEGFMLRKDGSRYFAHVTIRARRDAAGRLLGFASVARDLSLPRLVAEKEKLLSEAQAQEARQRLLARASATLLVQRESGRHLGSLAPLLVPVLGDVCLLHLTEWEEGATLPGRQFRVAARFAHDHLPREEDALEEALALRVPREHPIFWPRLSVAVGLDVETRKVLSQLAVSGVISVPVLSRRGVLGSITLLRKGGRGYRPRDLEVTQELARRVALSMENERLKERFREAAGLRQEFLSVVSHELRTPLTALHLSLHTLKELSRRRQIAGFTEPVRKRLEAAARQTARLSRLVDDLLDVPLMAGRAITLHHVEVDLRELCFDAIEQVREVSRRRGADVQVTVESPAVVGRWDPVKLLRVLTSLLEYGLRFGGREPIVISLEDDPAEGAFSLRVRGVRPGEAPTEGSVDPFEKFRDGAAQRSAGNATQLGLTMARRIVEAHGGTLQARRERNDELTFVVRLPKAEAASPTPPPATDASTPTLH